MTTAVQRSLGLDLLAYSIQGRVRNTLISTRTILSPENSVSSTTQKLLATSGTITITPSATAASLVIRSSGLVTAAVTLYRTGGNVVVTLNCNGLLVLTDSVVSVVVTNPSTTTTADISVVTI